MERKPLVLNGGQIEQLQTGDTINSSPSATVFIPFYFNSTASQVSFPLNSTPRTNGLLIVHVNGTFQSQPKGDYSVVGNAVVFATGLDAGDAVTGVYE